MDFPTLSIKSNISINLKKSFNTGKSSSLCNSLGFDIILISMIAQRELFYVIVKRLRLSDVSVRNDFKKMWIFTIANKTF